ncbi:unnamed protein product [Amoebophrya sp. A120]|nr:unnamed protein product [Amoebophrya sp. A120]|eukprot:GSA120T00019355001.1
MPRKLIPGSAVQLPAHEQHQPYSPEEMKRVFATSAAANISDVHKDHPDARKLPSKLDVDEQPEYLRIQEERRQALWDEVHGGFTDLMSQFDDFHQVLTGDVSELGDRLSAKHKKMIQDKLDREKYVQGLENRIKQLIEEKQYFQKVMESQYKMTNVYYMQAKMNEEYFERANNLEGQCRRMEQKAQWLQDSAVKWRNRYEKLKKHHDRLIVNLSKWMQREIKKIQRQQLLTAWETDVRITKIVDALDDSEKRLVVEREHWMKVVADVRSQLQDEKNVTNARRKRMRSLGEKALYRLRVLINPSSRPDLHKVCFRHWAIEALRTNGRIRDLRITQEAQQENKFLKLYVGELEAFRDDLNPQMWNVYMEQFSELQHENTELCLQLSETRRMAHEEFLTHRNVRLVIEREKWRERLRFLEARMRKAWKEDVKEVYEECYYLQQRNVNLERLANDGVDEAHGKKPLYPVVPKDVGIRCIDCAKKMVLQEERKKIACSPVRDQHGDPRSRSISPVLMNQTSNNQMSPTGLQISTRNIKQHQNQQEQLASVKTLTSPFSSRGNRHEMIPWTAEERERAELRQLDHQEFVEEERREKERRRKSSQDSAWGAFDIVEVPSHFQYTKEDEDDKPFPFEKPYSRKNVVKKASDQAKLLKKEFLQQFFENEQKNLPRLGWDASKASEFTANGGGKDLKEVISGPGGGGLMSPNRRAGGVHQRVVKEAWTNR